MPVNRRTAIIAGSTAVGLLALAGCSPAGLLNRVSRLGGDAGTRAAVRGVAYGPLPRQKLDVWVPATRSAIPLPVVIFFMIIQSKMAAGLTSGAVKG